MKSFSGSLSAAGLAVALALIGAPAMAQQKNGPAATVTVPGKPVSPAAIAAAKEILTMKNAVAMYANAIPSLVEKTKNVLLGANLNYQKDLNEVAVIVAKNLTGREKEIGDGMAQIYANEFTEQELKDLVTFYKSPLGQKLILNEPRAISGSMAYMNDWAQSFAEVINGQFRTEMRKRGKEI
ncbi:DUF2059 domain-containing protein [Bradyrhizobium sp. JYMT SZCCT0428]|uniref:DUF2059 domain-containing protein n=1 Tax=Bradyrhizobium sp. JYMT SZCCT0428 TaxID=2807673 RepID=UPI001BA709E6|nr:DUF2059 domain-containing protein [Bradyrhizobium sp. JYMT SZCCT0428]MBR1149555.1 DUF2059 domain-containing protein [Bradyrhizobium sp. JYMT SZCCT0428]